MYLRLTNKILLAKGRPVGEKKFLFLWVCLQLTIFLQHKIPRGAALKRSDEPKF